MIENDHEQLVGGIPTRLKNMKVSWDDFSQYMENKKCSKPPTRKNSSQVSLKEKNKEARGPVAHLFQSTRVEVLLLVQLLHLSRPCWSLVMDDLPTKNTPTITNDD